MKEHIRENSRVYLQDCMEGMKQFEYNYFDLAVVDPPYGIGINESIGRRKGQRHSGYKKATWDSKIPTPEYFSELNRISKNQIIWGGNYFLDYLNSTQCFLMWDKGFSEDVSFAQYELAWTSFKSSCKKYDKSPLQQHRFHPTQKPVALYDWIFKNYSEPNQKILDTHLGSQSSRIAANKAGLDFTGFELDDDYFNEGNKRYDNFIAQQRLF